MKKNLSVILLVIIFVFTTLILTQGSVFANLLVGGEDDFLTRDDLVLQLQTVLNVKLETKQHYRATMEEWDREGGVMFADIQHHWGRERIRHATYWGFLKGYPDSLFYPNQNISGTEGILVMNRFVNTVEGIDLGDDGIEYINWNTVPTWAREMMTEDPQIMKLMNQNENYGESDLTRLQFALMLARTLGFRPVDINEEAFGDQELIDEEVLPHILTLKKLGIIEGYKGNFAPDRPVTRAEIAVMFMRVIDILEEDELRLGYNVKRGKIMKRTIKRIFKEETGQGLTEYAMLIGFVAVAAIAALAVFKPKISTFFNSATDELDGEGFGDTTE